jgi:superfamily II RNA helicase
MSGRAGRRGLDTMGNIILLPQLFRDSLDKITLKNLLIGKSQRIESKFQIDTNIILESIKNNKNPKEFICSSLMNSEFIQKLKSVEIQIKITKELIEKTTPKITMFTSYKEYDQLVLKSKQNLSVNQRKKITYTLNNLNNQKYIQHYQQLKELEKQKEYLEYYVDDIISQNIEYLQKTNYLTSMDITLKGEISLVFRELDNLIGTNFVYATSLINLTENELLCVLVLLTKGKESNEKMSDWICKTINFVEENITSSTDLNKEYIYPVFDWYNQKSITDIVTNNNIFEGDLVKIINRIINYIDELVVAFTLKNNLNIIVLLINIKQKIERDIISPESLYLKVL